MNSLTIIEQARTLAETATFLNRIESQDQYNMACDLFEELIEDANNNEFLINILGDAIYKYEESASEFSEFNAQAQELNSGVSLLRVLMDQHKLKARDLEEELGSKTNISLILSGQRNLTIDHIKKLSQRFELNPGRFI